MSKFDSFFESPSDKNLTDKILKNAQVELENNRVHEKRKKLLWMIPFATAAASLFLFRFNSNDLKVKPEAAPENEDQLRMAAQLAEEDELFDILASIDMLEDLEFLESDENMEEG